MSKIKVLRFIVGKNALGVFINKDDEIEDLPNIVNTIFSSHQNNDHVTWCCDQPMIFAFEIYKSLDRATKYTTSSAVGLVNISNVSSVGIVEVENRVEDKYKKFVTYGAEND